MNITKPLIYRDGIPMIMGAKIGTSVTNTIVALTQIGEVEAFRKAFTCAVMHDLFNWLTVIVLLTLEVSSGFLNAITQATVDGFKLEPNDNPPEFLKALTKPFTASIIQLDTDVLHGWTIGDEAFLVRIVNLKWVQKMNQFRCFRMC